MHDAIGAATHIEVEIEPRCWEDAIVDGMRDEDGALIPGRTGDQWRARIRLADGRIEGWPSGVTARIHYKVCDAGLYWLADAAGTHLARYRGSSVPGAILCHGDQGFGDYIILGVAGDGAINEYRRPPIDQTQWEPIGDTGHRT